MNTSSSLRTIRRFQGFVRICRLYTAPTVAQDSSARYRMLDKAVPRFERLLCWRLLYSD